MPNINTILANLNANYSQITDLISTPYLFIDDLKYGKDEFDGVFVSEPFGSAILRLSSGELIWVGAAGTAETVKNVRKFNNNYELDENFICPDFEENSDGIVNTVDVQSSGKIIIGGNFSTLDGSPYGKIARLNSNGTIDSTFNLGEAGFDGAISQIKVLDDDTIIVVGYFNSYNAVSVPGICKLDEDGVLVASEDFDASGVADLDGNVLCLKIDASDKIYVGGSFTTRLLKLNADGSQDTSFYHGTGFNGDVKSIEIDGDGKLFVGGDFTTHNGTACNPGIVRITTATGSAKTITNIAISSGGTTTITSASHGLVTGDTITISGSDSDSDIDGNWIVTVSNNNQFTIATSSVTVAGSNGSLVKTAGNLDYSFENQGSGLANTGPTLLVNSIAVQSNGKIVVGGHFNSYDESQKGLIIRFNSDGTEDTSFDTGFGFNIQGSSWGDPQVSQILINVDGSILCTGNIMAYQFSVANSFVKLSSTGTNSGIQILKYKFTCGITDGGNDMYDGGNFFNTNLTQSFETVRNNGILDVEGALEASIPNTHSPGLDQNAYKNASNEQAYLPPMDGQVKSGTNYFGAGSQYFTNYYPKLFVLVAVDISIDEFCVSGNVGSNGDTLNNVYFEQQVNGKLYSIFMKTNVENGEDDPSINHIIIIPGKSTNLTQIVNPDGLSYDDHAIQGLNSRNELYFLNIARAEAQELSTADASLIVEAFLNLIQGTDPEIVADFDCSPVLTTRDTDGSLDTVLDVNGNSVQRTLNGILVKRNGQYKIFGKINDGGQYDNNIQTLTDYLSVVEN